MTPMLVDLRGRIVFLFNAQVAPHFGLTWST